VKYLIHNTILTMFLQAFSCDEITTEISITLISIQQQDANCTGHCDKIHVILNNTIFIKIHYFGKQVRPINSKIHNLSS
jgi:hypothetical protein